MSSGYDKLFKFAGNMTSSPSANKIINLKRKNDIPLMSSEQLKEKFQEYESINKMINENINEQIGQSKNIINDDKKEEEYKKRDHEIMFKKIKQLEEEKLLKDKLKKKEIKNEEDEYEGELEDMLNKEKKEEEKIKKEEEERIKKQ